MMKNAQPLENRSRGEEALISDIKGPFLFPVPDIRRAENALSGEDNISQKIIDCFPGWFYLMDQQLNLVFWNDNFRQATGCSNEELRGMSVLEFYKEAQQAFIAEELIRVFRLGEYAAEADIAFREGTVRTFYFNFKQVCYGNAPCLAAAAFDVSGWKGGHVHFSRQPQNTSLSLQVSLRSEKEGRQATEDKLKANLEDLVIPHLKKLKATNLNATQRKHLEALVNHLNDVLSPFVNSLLLIYSNLTPQEIQIADLVRSGNGTKEIADTLNTSVNTIATHRNNIRKKLNLRNTKVNLRTHLQTIL